MANHHKVQHAESAEQYMFQYLSSDEARWYGKGAELLGLPLNEPIKRADYKAVLRRRDPRNPDVKLTGRDPSTTGKRLPVLAYELKFHVPKSVSLIACFDNRVLKARDEVLREVLAEMESLAAVTRQSGLERGKGGRAGLTQTNALTFAIFPHYESRHGDPHFHAHVQMMNFSFDPESKKWFALQAEALFAHEAHFRKMFQAGVAKKLRELGYELNGTGDCYEVRGVSLALRQENSRSRQRALQDHHVTESAIQRAVAESLRERGFEVVGRTPVSRAARRSLAGWPGRAAAG